MKPANFPGRINQRRIGALERLKKAKKSDYINEQIDVLEKRILSQEEAESIQTKVRRDNNVR